MVAILSKGRWVNSLWPSDAIRRQGTESTLAQVMACCLTAPSHYLNQCWLIIGKVQWHSSADYFTRYTSPINHHHQLENCLYQFSFKSPRDQWVNSQRLRDVCVCILGHNCFIKPLTEPMTYHWWISMALFHIQFTCCYSEQWVWKSYILNYYHISQKPMS